MIRSIKPLALLILALVSFLGCKQTDKLSLTLGSTFDFVPTVERVSNQLSPTQILPVEFDLTLSHEVGPSGIPADSIVNRGTATGVVWNVTAIGDNRRFRVSAISVSGDGTIIPVIPEGKLRSTQDALNVESVFTSEPVLYEITPPRRPEGLSLSAFPSDYLSGSPKLTWLPSSDAETAVDYYEVGIVRAKDRSVVSSWQPVSGTEYEASGLSLNTNETLLFYVRAVDQAGNVSEIAESSMWNTGAGSDATVLEYLDTDN